MLALDQLSDRLGVAALPAVRAMLAKSKVPEQKAYGLWVLHRLGKAQTEDYAKLVHDESVPVEGTRFWRRANWKASTIGRGTHTAGG